MKRLVMSLLAVAASLCATAATLYVDYENGTDSEESATFKTLAYAVGKANPNDEIVLAKGTHVLGGNVSVGVPLTIRGEGENWETLVVGANAARSLTFSTGSADGSVVHSLTFPGSRSEADKYYEVTFSPHAQMMFSNVVFRSIGANPTACSSGRLIYSQGKLTFRNVWVTNCLFKGQADGAFIGLRTGPHTFENCVFAGNSTSAAGCIFYTGWNEPVVRNCSFVGNRLYSGYAVYVQTCNPKFENTLVWGNVDIASGAERNMTFTELGNTKNFKSVCSTPIAGWSGTGHVDSNPMYYGVGQILAASPCAATGDASCMTSVDILGNQRGAQPSIGAFEPVVPDVMVCGITASAAKASSIELGCTLEGPQTGTCTYAWDLDGDGEFDDSDDPAPVLSAAGVYQASVRVTDGAGQVATASYGRDLLVRSDDAMTFYVDTENGDDGNSGMARDAAWKDLAKAVDKSQVMAGDEIVLVTGTHRLVSDVTVGKAITLRGEGAKEDTILVSAGTTARTLGTSVEGVLFHSFTMAGSKDGTNSSEVKITMGGGETTISNVVVRSVGDNPLSCTPEYLWYTEKALVIKDVWVTNCLFQKNFVYLRGGKRVENCVVHDNTTAAAGHLFRIEFCKPDVINCTITGNRMASGSALYLNTASDLKFHNNLIWDNVDVSTKAVANVLNNGTKKTTFLKNCTTPLDADWPAGNIDADPKLQDDGLHFFANSPCNHTADPATATVFDIEGRPRGEQPSIGAFEYVAPKGLTCSIDVSGQVVRRPHTLTLSCQIYGDVTGSVKYAWDFDGDDDVDSTDAEPEISEIGVYQPRVSIVDDAGLTANATYGGQVVVHAEGATTYYVDNVCGDDDGDGTAPESGAWKTIAAMVGKVSLLDGDEVVLARGSHPLAADVRLAKSIWLHGAGENWETRIVGEGANRTLQVDVAGALISNFTIPGANSDLCKSVQLKQTGASTISNVVATALGDNLRYCGQVFFAAGGSSGSLFTHLWVTNCLFGSNGGVPLSSGIYAESNARFENCLVADNRMDETGIGTGTFAPFYSINAHTTVRYCTFANNECYKANAVVISGNGLHPEYSNLIVWNNVDKDSGEAKSFGIQGNWMSPECVHHVCANSTNNLASATNIIDDPLFKNAAKGDYTLTVASPCRNTGLNGAWSEGTTDLRGNPRRTGRITDRGCFELPYGYGLMLMVK